MNDNWQSRTETLENMEKEPLDLFVIGGGITGAGIALDAVARGLRVGLADMQDFAGGTSSRSTKLVHGGLRYLKQFEVKVVAEVGKERAIVYENAPHVTTPEKMMLPIYTGGTFGRFSTSIGLKVYDFLAGVVRSERRVMLSRKQTLDKEPLLKQDGLKGSGYYVEYRTDDARLTIEVIKEAAARGALAVNYVKVEQLLYDSSKQLTGVRLVDQLTSHEYTISARKIVNAAGPWVDQIRTQDHSNVGKHLHLTKGVHLVIDGARFPMKQSVYFDTTNGDKRMLFVIPRQGKVYAGTTDTTYSDWPIDPKPTEQDKAYILDAINGMFPSVKLTADDVESSWAGVRPLIQEEGKSPSEISRKDEIFVAPSGLISIAGGKLTGYRKMAERVVDVVADALEKQTGASIPPCQTKHLELSGGHVGGSMNYPDFLQTAVKEGVASGLSEEEAVTLASRYGTNVSKLFAYCRSNHKEASYYQLTPAQFAAVQYGVSDEMVVSPVDYFTRRSSMTLFAIDEAKAQASAVLHYLSDVFAWTAERKQAYADELRSAFFDATGIDAELITASK
ncbi:MAG: glycerol-3-phosphate dehydrogenase/oxidase [Sporolactobacillus sp.]